MFYCSDEYGASVAAPWSGADAFASFSAVRTVSGPIRSTTYSGVSVCLFVPGESAGISTVPHTRYSKISLQVRGWHRQASEWNKISFCMLSLLNTKYHHVKALLKTCHLSGNIIGFSFENSNVRTARVLRLSGGGGGEGGLGWRAKNGFEHLLLAWPAVLFGLIQVFPPNVSILRKEVCSIFKSKCWIIRNVIQLDVALTWYNIKHNVLLHASVL